MQNFNKVVPGQVKNEGIVSRENLASNIPVISSPAHFPDFAMVTPRGPTKRATVGTGAFTSKFGDTTDPFGPYYNPVALAIQKLGQAGQASFSFKRLTANEERARSIFGVIVFENQDVPNYKRRPDGDYLLSQTGKLQVEEGAPTVKGVFAVPAVHKTDAAVEIGKAQPVEFTVTETDQLVPENAVGTFYPMFEMLSGVGDEYNHMYFAIGHGQSTDWGEISKFVRTYGSYPYTLNLGEQLENNIRVPSSTINGSPDSSLTLFDTVGPSDLLYGIQKGLDNFTGRNVNRPVQTTAAPFEDAFVYTNNINLVCQKLYEAEYPKGVGAPIVQTKRLPAHAIMNPLSFLNHEGKPYRHIVFGGLLEDGTGKLNTTRVSLNHYLFASGGIYPYADKAGKFPAKPSTWDEATDGPWVPEVGSPAVISHKQYWEMNQALLLGYLTSYAESLDLKDVIRNRTSFFWDLGYNEDIKDALIHFLSKRKDIIVVLCATEYLRKKTPEQIYATSTMLNTKLLMIPESDTFQTSACRAAINLWDVRIVNERTFGRFSLNIDTMYAFAYAGGGADGKVYFERMPDHKGNRTLRVAHDPLVQFEADDPAANNLILGAISVTPLNEEQFCRPALPTVYPDMNSVLKDLTNPWKAVCVEKILADNWIQISGDPQIPREGYVSFMKDASEARIRDNLGAVLSSWAVEPGFRENQPDSKSTMYCVTKLWMGKGYYMLNSVLEAYNQDQLTAE